MVGTEFNHASRLALLAGEHLRLRNLVLHFVVMHHIHGKQRLRPVYGVDWTEVFGVISKHH